MLKANSSKKKSNFGLSGGIAKYGLDPTGILQGRPGYSESSMSWDDLVFNSNAGGAATKSPLVKAAKWLGERIDHTLKIFNMVDKFGSEATISNANIEVKHVPQKFVVTEFIPTIQYPSVNTVYTLKHHPVHPTSREDSISKLAEIMARAADSTQIVP